LLIEKAEMKTRMDKWNKPDPKYLRGWLNRYERLVTSAAFGAVLNVPKL
jgi:dihydroxy-acid dehydratase